MNLMHFLRRPISLRQRLILTIGAILLVFELISVFWLWHESTEQIQLFEQALRDNRNNDRHIMREIREAVASLRETLRREDGTWFVDYVRIRIKAVKV